MLVMSKQAVTRFASLVEVALQRYGSVWGFSRQFVRGKLLHDPVYNHLMRHTAWVPNEGLVLDLGCGRGILLSLLATALQSGALNRPGVRLMGVETRASDAEVARKALGDAARIEQQDVLDFVFPVCRTIILLDVLLYIDAAGQLTLLDNIAAHLEADGLLIIREADAAMGWRFTVTALVERLCAWARFDIRQRYHYRSRAEWITALEARGFRIRVEPMSSGTPFANVLMLAHRTNPED